jgi:hypothetical protein
MDDRIRKIRKRKKNPQTIDVGMILLSLIGSTVGCMLVGLLVPWLRWLLLVSGALNVIGGIGLIIYVLCAFEEEELLFDIESAPRTFSATFVMLLGVGEMILYVALAMRHG